MQQGPSLLHDQGLHYDVMVQHLINAMQSRARLRLQCGSMLRFVTAGSCTEDSVECAAACLQRGSALGRHLIFFNAFFPAFHICVSLFIHLFLCARKILFYSCAA